MATLNKAIKHFGDISFKKLYFIRILRRLELKFIKKPDQVKKNYPKDLLKTGFIIFTLSKFFWSHFFTWLIFFSFKLSLLPLPLVGSFFIVIVYKLNIINFYYCFNYRCYALLLVGIFFSFFLFSYCYYFLL